MEACKEGIIEWMEDGGWMGGEVCSLFEYCVISINIKWGIMD